MPVLFGWLIYLRVTRRYFRKAFSSTIKLSVIVFLLTLSTKIHATHIRAGEITAVQINGLEYSFTFTGYRDSGPNTVLFGNGLFDFGDGVTFGGPNGEAIPWVLVEDLGNDVEKWQFTLRHEYTAAAPFLVSYTEDFRNAEIQNISGSVSTPFHVETLVIVDQLISNSTPFFTVPPIDQGVVGAVFEHDPGAFDPDGDSLVFYFTTPKQGSAQDVGGYQVLNAATFYDDFENGNSVQDGRPTLTLDPQEGILVWDAPGGANIPDMQCREWNVAFVVEEWRTIEGRAFRLGFVTRDMQIIVCDFENEPPELELPPDTCVIAGKTITALVTGTDPDGDQVRLEAFGGPFEVVPSASFSPDPAVFQDIPASLEFTWNTACGVVRENAYEVQFKATDAPNIPNIGPVPGLSNFETWRIKVVGPPPEGLSVNSAPGRQMHLSWDPYSCPQADSMQIWRRVGSFELDPSCEPGIPEAAGYELIKTQEITDTTFIDNNGGLGLSSGAKYCYRLVASFPEPTGGLSVPSAEACDSLIIDAPVITKVDINTTDESDGEIFVEWTSPLDRDAGFAPYTYEVLRKQGMDSEGTFIQVRAPSNDTTFTDTGLNTFDFSYSYKIILYDNTNQPIDSSAQASSVRLVPNAKIGAIELSWRANVPWSNTDPVFNQHLIFRDNVDPNNLESLVLIDSVDVTENGFLYLDDGSFNNTSLLDDSTYCYFVTTRGFYDNDRLPRPLLNRSQITCAQPADSIPPCTPLDLSFSSDNNFRCETQFNCGEENQELENRLTWQSNIAPECDDDIAFFRIYTAKSREESEFVLLGTTDGNAVTEFVHDSDIFNAGLPLNSLAFCYYITAVDRSGNESQISDIVCNENCPQYLLPNVFTPNDDEINDTFVPLQANGQCPRFVETVIFKVFSRTGVELFTYDSEERSSTDEGSVSQRAGISIGWNGKDNNGRSLTAGVYYYSAEVTFITLNPEDRRQVIKGWVQILK
ncbi:MAG: gliding motility-associated C-terminal domain-containing protein [Bacteroidota bacterium]